MGEFNLLSPNRLYQELKYHLNSKKNWKINIETFFKEKQTHLFNFIYYFSAEELAFDFLLPFKNIDDEKMELIQDNIGFIIRNINRNRFSVLEVNEYDKINKSLTVSKGDENFIPIDISNKDDDKNGYFDLVPCLTNYFYELYNIDPNEEVENADEEDNNQNNIIENDNDSDNNINYINEDGVNYFSINGIPK